LTKIEQKALVLHVKGRKGGFESLSRVSVNSAGSRWECKKEEGKD
jgi:hypothetical protein